MHSTHFEGKVILQLQDSLLLQLLHIKIYWKFQSFSITFSKFILVLLTFVILIGKKKYFSSWINPFQCDIPLNLISFWFNIKDRKDIMRKEVSTFAKDHHFPAYHAHEKITKVFLFSPPPLLPYFFFQYNIKYYFRTYCFMLYYFNSIQTQQIWNIFNWMLNKLWIYIPNYKNVIVLQLQQLIEIRKHWRKMQIKLVMKIEQ